MLSFFYQCKRRLQALGYTESDEVFRAVAEAHAALHALILSYGTRVRTRNRSETRNCHRRAIGRFSEFDPIGGLFLLQVLTPAYRPNL